MKFEIGKYYQHTTGEVISILGSLRTTMYGESLIAETSDGWNLKPVGLDESHTDNWIEVTKEVWMENFSTTEQPCSGQSVEQLGPSEVHLIRQALVIEIRDAVTWIEIVRAWQGLLKVRRMAKSMKREAETACFKSHDRVSPDELTAVSNDTTSI